MKLPSLDPSGWFVYSSLDALDKGIVSRELFGIKYIAFKNSSNDILVTIDSCPHRGYPLSKGLISNDNLQCSYHGWKFNQNGDCIQVPGTQNCPKFKLKLITYHSHEGYLWICLGEKQSLPSFELMKNSIESSLLFNINAHHFLIFENTFDRMHIPTVHKNFVTKTSKTVKYRIKCHQDKLEITNLSEGKQVGFLSSLFGSNSDIAIERYIYPGIIQLEFLQKTKTKLLFTIFLSPVNKDKTQLEVKIQYCKSHLLLSPILTPLLRWFTKRITQQDIKYLENQHSKLRDSNLSFSHTAQDYVYKYLEEIVTTKGKAKLTDKSIELKLV